MLSVLKTNSVIHAAGVRNKIYIATEIHRDKASCKMKFTVLITHQVLLGGGEVMWIPEKNRNTRWSESFTAQETQEPLKTACQDGRQTG